ncbi:MAG: prenyltransferase [Bacteroidales bacterium]|nr:prenyltransferase [Bacteroidales bacterium]
MRKSISFWWSNARPISLPQSLLPALTAVALSIGASEFNWIAALASVAGVIFLHLGLNLMDDWFDYKEGSAEARAKVANEGFRGRMIKYPYLTSNEATPSQLLKAIAVFMGIAATMGAVAILARDLRILWWVAAGLVIGVSYSGGPLKLGYRGLGELVIFLMFGPLLMTGAYYAITGTVDWKIGSLSIAVGLLVTNIVYSHSVLDSVPDQKMGKKTMAHLMGSAKGQIVFSALLNTLPYLIVAAAVIFGKMHPAYLAVLLVFPVSMWLVGSLNDFVNNREVPIEPKKWMGPMGDFDKYRKAGIDWFLLRWLTARNIVTFFCTIIIVVNLIFG